MGGSCSSRCLGRGADFRDGQWEAIDLAANQRRRWLVVQRTGWGKSIVYFLAARLLRDAGNDDINGLAFHAEAVAAAGFRT